MNQRTRVIFTPIEPEYPEVPDIPLKPLNPLSPDKDTLNFHERLPSLTPTGRAKWIEGNLDLRIPAEPYSLKPDTVKLVLQMFDRSLNKSNTIETEPIILKH